MWKIGGIVLEGRLREVAYTISGLAHELDERTGMYPSALGGLARAAMKLLLMIADSVQRGQH